MDATVLAKNLTVGMTIIPPQFTTGFTVTGIFPYRPNHFETSYLRIAYRHPNGGPEREIVVPSDHPVRLA